uniref:Tektin n=2 Tax=Macrostomum lignano TaxID=282301 RepID=A0A1I8GZC7_9PLAT
MAKVVNPPPRYTHPEWTFSNNQKYRNAELERAAAERLKAESDRIIEETAKKTAAAQADVDKKLNQRLNDVKYWREEVDEKLAGVSGEIDRLGAFISRVDKALESYQEPLHISQQCLINREGRIGIDLVHDDVQKELLKEVEVNQGAQALLLKTLEQAKEQLRLNRKAKYQLEKDIADKRSAEQLDSHCVALKANSAGLGRSPCAVGIDSKSVSPEEWQELSNRNILEAEKQRQNSAHMCSIVDGILQAVANDLEKQKSCVDIAVKRRVAETRDSKAKLEEHLAQVLAEVKDMEVNIDKLESAIAEKEQPLKVAETRLKVRGARPNVEQCRDPAQFRLVEEVGGIQASVEALSQRLAASRDSLKGLLRRQLDLEEEIQIKANTLYIDEVQCGGLRGSIQIHSF